MSHNWKENLTESEIEEIQSSIEIETYFYQLLAGTLELEVLPLPDEELTTEDIENIGKECTSRNIKLLYRISHSNYATILNPETGITGIVPDNNPNGFRC
jgi:hypothetical protein